VLVEDDMIVGREHGTNSTSHSLMGDVGLQAN
jgi:hypothetical protein